MWTWEQLKNKTFDKKYPRTVEDECEYQYHKLLVKEFFVDIEEYISTLNIDPFEPYILIKNRFPYKTSPDVRHYVLWIKPGYNIQVATIIQNRFPGREIIFYQNAIQNRSIMTIDHYQVFIK